MAGTEMKGAIAPDFIAQLRAGQRKRNAYAPKIIEFDESGELGVNVKDAWPELKDKNAATLYQGFNNAIKSANKELADSDRLPVEVLRREDDVFILRNDS